MAGFLHPYAPGNGRFFFSHTLRTLALIWMMALLASCSSSDPQIMQVDHYVVASWNPTREGFGEALVVSLDVFDPDGAGELETVDVRVAAFDLRWTLDAEDLSYHEQDGQRWYTTPRLTITDQARFPRGEVEITVTDLSGREDLRNVSIPRTLPDFEVDDVSRLDAGGTVRTSDEVDTLLIIFESADGRREVREISEPAGTVTLSRVYEPAVVRRLQEAAEPVRMWLLQEWSPRIYLESGPWEVDPGELSFSNSP
jgi:hypothetical protein